MANKNPQTKKLVAVLAALTACAMIVIAWHFWFAETGKAKQTTAPVAVPPAQTSKAREPGTQTIWYDPPHELQKKAVIRWMDEKVLPTGGNTLFKELTMDTFQETGERGLIMEAPECVFNLHDFSGTSPGTLKMRTADGNSFIEGNGYFWTYKGSNLTVAISNNVSTTLKRDFLTPGTNSFDRAASATNQFVYIHADRVVLDRAANLVTYTGHVRAEDERLDLTCEILTIRGTTNGVAGESTNTFAGGKISEMVADRNVVIFDKATGGSATGERAVYGLVDGAEAVVLTGEPRWRAGPRNAAAQTFIYNLSANRLRAVGEAHFQLPSDSLNQSGFLMLSPPSGKANASNTNVGLVDIRAGAITLELPATNGAPLRGVIAETNVLMVDETNNSRASADRAVYTQTNGEMELTGNASWQMDRRLARGGLLTFNQSNNTFSAHTNAFLQFPPNELKQSTGLGGLLATNTGRTTNQLIQVASDSYDYLNDTLTFSNHVRGAYLEDETVRGTLESRVLTVGFLNTNILKDLTAEGGVQLHELPTQDTPGKTEEGDFKSDRLHVQMRTNGLIELITATGGVAAEQTKISTNGAGRALFGQPASASATNALLRTNHTTFSADLLTASFLPTTNKADVVTGEGNVRMTQDDLMAGGAKAVYTATNDVFVLTGDPRLKTTDLSATSDEMIIYDRAKGILQVTRHAHEAYQLPDVALDKFKRPAMMQPKPK